MAIDRNLNVYQGKAYGKSVVHFHCKFRSGSEWLFIVTALFAKLSALASNALDLSDACVLLDTRVTFLC